MGLVMEVRRSRLKMFAVFAFVVAAAYACNLLSESRIVAGKAWFASWIFTILAVFTLGAAIFRIQKVFSRPRFARGPFGSQHL